MVDSNDGEDLMIRHVSLLTWRDDEWHILPILAGRSAAQYPI